MSIPLWVHKPQSTDDGLETFLRDIMNALCNKLESSPKLLSYPSPQGFDPFTLYIIPETLLKDFFIEILKRSTQKCFLGTT